MALSQLSIGGNQEMSEAQTKPIMSGEKPDLNRAWIVRAGKRLRKRINPYIKRHSKVGNTPILDRQHFPWLTTLEDNWEVMRKEAEEILKYRDAIPSLSDISPDHAKLDDEKKWRSYFLWGYGFKSKENCARCPKTTAFVEQIPGLKTALFSIHEPGMTIAPHKGVTAGICVAHLGLKIPDKHENCAIRVKDDIVHWRNGEAFVFDDTFKHETWNHTDEERIILLLHFNRPTRFPGSLLAWVFMTGIRWSPFIGDARSEMGKWNTRFSKMEAADQKP
ncbi:MAG: aspartyl/asparaginyl beta-hydroxylase domain-containing protein [Litorimonas sp.]